MKLTHDSGDNTGTDHARLRAHSDLKRVSCQLSATSTHTRHVTSIINTSTKTQVLATYAYERTVTLSVTAVNYPPRLRTRDRSHHLVVVERGGWHLLCSRTMRCGAVRCSAMTIYKQCNNSNCVVHHEVMTWYITLHYAVWCCITWQH